jgi:hypothetical protein
MLWHIWVLVEPPRGAAEGRFQKLVLTVLRVKG